MNDFDFCPVCDARSCTYFHLYVYGADGGCGIAVGATALRDIAEALRTLAERSGHAADKRHSKDGGR